MELRGPDAREKVRIEAVKGRSASITMEMKAPFAASASGGKLTVKVDDKDKEYKVPDDLKVKFKGKDGEEKEFPASGMLSRRKEGQKLKLEVDGDTVKKISREGKGKGK